MMLDIIKQLPTAYRMALTQTAQRLGRPPEDCLYEALDSWLEKENSNQVLPTQTPQPVKDQTTPIGSSQLDVIPTGNTFGILMEQDNSYWLENTPYSNLSKALNQIREYAKIGHTNLNNWISMSGEYPLVILQKSSGLPHIWLGQNSACKIFNNKDVKPDGFKLSTEFPKQNICKSCVNNYKETASPRVHLVFDSKKRLLATNIQSFDPLF